MTLLSPHLLPFSLILKIIVTGNFFTKNFVHFIFLKNMPSRKLEIMISNDIWNIILQLKNLTRLIIKSLKKEECHLISLKSSHYSMYHTPEIKRYSIFDKINEVKHFKNLIFTLSTNYILLLNLFRSIWILKAFHLDHFIKHKSLISALFYLFMFFIFGGS